MCLIDWQILHYPHVGGLGPCLGPLQLWRICMWSVHKVSHLTICFESNIGATTSLLLAQTSRFIFQGLHLQFPMISALTCWEPCLLLSAHWIGSRSPSHSLYTIKSLHDIRLHAKITKVSSALGGLLADFLQVLCRVEYFYNTGTHWEWFIIFCIAGILQLSKNLHDILNKNLRSSWSMIMILIVNTIHAFMPL